MFRFLRDIITAMRTRKDGSTDKRFKNKIEAVDPTQITAPIEEIQEPKTDPQTLFNNLLELNGLKIDFDVLEGTIPTQYGIIKLDKPTLVVKASYVNSK